MSGSSPALRILFLYCLQRLFSRLKRCSTSKQPSFPLVSRLILPPLSRLRESLFAGEEELRNARRRSFASVAMAAQRSCVLIFTALTDVFQPISRLKTLYGLHPAVFLRFSRLKHVDLIHTAAISLVSRLKSCAMARTAVIYLVSRLKLPTAVAKQRSCAARGGPCGALLGPQAWPSAAASATAHPPAETANLHSTKRTAARDFGKFALQYGK